MTARALIVPVLLASIGTILLYVDVDAESTGKFLAQSQKRLGRFPDRTKVRHRLTLVGRENDYQNFRMRQVSQALLAAAISFSLAFMAMGSFLTACLIAIFISIGAYFYVDQQLSREVKKYRSSIESEFPAIIEMLTLALSAGEIGRAHV